MRAIRVIRAPKTFTGAIRTASDSWDWLTPEDVVRHALAAYYATCRRMERYVQEEGSPEAVDRLLFAGGVWADFARKVETHGLEGRAFTEANCAVWGNGLAMAELLDEPWGANIKGAEK